MSKKFKASGDTWRIRLGGPAVTEGHRNLLFVCESNGQRPYRVVEIPDDGSADEVVLERFGSNDELVAYIQSPAGSNFLKGSPVVTDEPSGGMVSAPLGRILWSVQAGAVLASGGVGLLIVRRYIMEELGDLLLTMGGLALSLGAGFALAALASYFISNRLGLFETQSDEDGSHLTGGA